MHRKFLDYLVDPLTKEPLTLEVVAQMGDVIETGFLRSKTGEYPIVRGIPRFVKFLNQSYAESFSYQWHKWPKVQFESENKGKVMEGHTRRMFEKRVGLDELSSELIDKVIVDIGCGPGRFIDVARTKGANVIGIDYSAAVEVAKENFKNDTDVCICQADALHLPLRANSVDCAFSIGVLHHTPDPQKAVKEVYRIIQNKGWFALSVYAKGGYYDLPPVQFWRRIFKFLWPIFKHYPPLMYTYFANDILSPIVSVAPSLGKIIQSIFPFLKLPDRNWALLDTFDSVTPSYQSAHEQDEVHDWLKCAGFDCIGPTCPQGISLKGVKNFVEQ